MIFDQTGTDCCHTAQHLHPLTFICAFLSAILYVTPSYLRILLWLFVTHIYLGPSPLQRVLHIGLPFHCHM